MAAAGLVERWSQSPDELPVGAIARVGGKIITLERYLQVLNDLAADKRAPLSAQDRQFVIDRVIDEELLIQRGIELGLADSSPQIRKALAAAVIGQLTAEAEANLPGEQALRRLYESDPEFFTSTARYRLRWLRLPASDDAAQRKAENAYRQLSNGVTLEEVRQSTGLEPVPILPDALLPLSKIMDYLGPTLASQVSMLKRGVFSKPIEGNGDLHILQLLEYQPEVLPPFEQARPVLEAEYLRRAGDDALRQYLQWLRLRSEVIVDLEMVHQT
ncbi:MAG: peptidylprolyl isomerase [Lysobacterales bacterium]